MRRGGERKRLDLLVRPLQPGDPESKVSDYGEMTKNQDALVGDMKKYSVTDNLKPRDASPSKKKRRSHYLILIFLCVPFFISVLDP